MAYYAALISLKQTIERFLYSNQILIPPPSQHILTYEDVEPDEDVLRKNEEIILSNSSTSEDAVDFQKILEDAYREVRSYVEVLKTNEEIINSKSSDERVISLNGQIRDAAYKLEDAIESHVSKQSECPADEGISKNLLLDLEEVKEEISSFIETVKKIEKIMMEELSKPLPEEDDVVTSEIDFDGKNSKMVGLSIEFNRLKIILINCRLSLVIPIVGMAGIGKTALAMKICQDPSISSHFDLRVFVTVGLKFQFRKAMLNILAQLNHNIKEICMGGDEDLAEHIRRSLQGRRYLIVFDDVWNTQDFKDLVSLFPEDNTTSQVLLTTRLEEVAHNARLYFLHMRSIHYMRFLSKEESWDLLCEKVFGEGNLCPLRLEKFGKKIAENCEGLPLAIVTVANILSKEEKTLEYWEKVAKKENSVFTNAYEQMSEVLISSYNNLPQYLKPCFLYMGVFPQSFEIPVSKLVKLWHAEGFLNLFPLINVEDLAKKCVRELESRSVVLPNQWSTRCGNYTKSCHLHSAYWHLCTKEACKEKFFHAINHYASSFTEGIKSQRRLCIRYNVLFGIKEAHNSMGSISMARSLLCTGPYHQYPVPICSDLRLLRVLDALTIRFYKFPIEVLKLVLLRYLALTCCGKVPGSISKLWNLEHLVVHRHQSINNPFDDSSYLPIEIWNMKELRHIQVMGSNLPNPCGAALSNLLTLSNISVNSCSKEILEKTPNLKKLGIQIELKDTVEPLCCFDHLSHLDYLESFKCIVVNPKPKSQVVPSIATFPTHLKKLSFSGLGYSWDHMRTIAKLPNLEALKLQCYAFQGPFWEIREEEFLSLKSLLIEDTDLEHWRGHHNNCLRSLQRLILSHCYKLKEIPSTLGTPFIIDYQVMKLVDCPSFGASARQLQEQYKSFEIYVCSSWDDEKPGFLMTAKHVKQMRPESC